MSGSWASALAANRFGLGARPGELDRIGDDPEGWLARQTADPVAFSIPSEGLSTSQEAVAALGAYRMERRERREAANATQAEQQLRGMVQPLRASIVEDSVARMRRALTTPAPFAERLALFWANHFTVAATKLPTIPLVGPFEREAVRANLTRRFEDLLLAVTRHPGMLLYLDQAQSVGPSSVAGRRRDAGLNENLAREILELHTVGPQAGYTQADVTEFARALTGWTIAGPRLRRFAPDAAEGAFVFVEALHEPGARTVLGRRYPDDGEGQARAILMDLAAHPATARRIAFKLARHFTADEPPAAAVAHLERAFQDSRGSLPALHAALIAMPEAWREEQRKVKSPNEFLISALRAVGLETIEPRALGAAYELLGQPMYRAPSPEGWPDDAPSWLGPDALMKRLEWSQALAERVGGRTRPVELARQALGAQLTAETRIAIERAEGAAQGLVLALMAPEFQRR